MLLIHIYIKNKLKFTLDLDECYYKGYQENYYTVIDNIIDNAKDMRNQK